MTTSTTTSRAPTPGTLSNLAETLVDALLDPETGRDVAFLKNAAPDFVRGYLIPELQQRGGQVLFTDMARGKGSALDNFFEGLKEAIRGLPWSPVAETGDTLVDLVWSMRVGISRPIALVIDRADLFAVDAEMAKGLDILHRAVKRIAKMQGATGKDFIIVFNGREMGRSQGSMTRMIEASAFAGEGVLDLAAAAALSVFRTPSSWH